LLEPSIAFPYATLSLPFANISGGRTLTHFAAPSVLMFVGKWNWDTIYMFMHFGIRTFIGVQ
jgi:hypothetical protein